MTTDVETQMEFSLLVPCNRAEILAASNDGNTKPKPTTETEQDPVAGIFQNCETDVNKALQEQAFQDKTFEGNLMDKFRTQNLDKAARALTLGSGMLTAEQERQLRAALTREGYSLQDKLASNDLSFRRDALGQQAALSMADLDQRAMMALLNG